MRQIQKALDAAWDGVCVGSRAVIPHEVRPVVPWIRTAVRWTRTKDNTLFVLELSEAMHLVVGQKAITNISDVGNNGIRERTTFITRHGGLER